MDEEPDKEERDERTLLTEAQEKLYFEYYKHLSTLDAAGAVFLLAIYRELGIVASRIAVTLTTFAISLIIAGFGLTTLLWSAGYNPRRLHFWLTLFASGFFIAGVLSFTLLRLILQ